MPVFEAGQSNRMQLDIERMIFLLCEVERGSAMRLREHARAPPQEETGIGVLARGDQWRLARKLHWTVAPHDFSFALIPAQHEFPRKVACAAAETNGISSDRTLFIEMYRARLFENAVIVCGCRSRWRKQCCHDEWTAPHTPYLVSMSHPLTSTTQVRLNARNTLHPSHISWS